MAGEELKGNRCKDLELTRVDSFFDRPVPQLVLDLQKDVLLNGAGIEPDAIPAIDQMGRGEPADVVALMGQKRGDVAGHRPFSIRAGYVDGTPGKRVMNAE